MTTGTNDDWLNAPAPPPKAVGDPAHKPGKATKAPAKRAEGRKTPMRPLDKLAADMDAAPVAAAPPGDGLDPPEDPQQQDAAGADAGAPPPPPPPGARDKRPRGEIWKGCPVRPLGVNGAFSYYLDVHGQMRPVAKHDAQTIMHLFGSRIPALNWAFPQFDKDGNRKPHRFDQTTAAMDMMAACSERGLFDPDGSVRGVGAWRDDEGQLIYHTGDRLLMVDGESEPMTHQDRIYPAYPPIPHPAPADKITDPVPQILDQLETWNWARPDIDPYVSLGMVCVQMMGGALDWRPTFWATGPRAAGKSSFQKLIEYLHGPKGLVQSSDATKSGITARLGHSSLPVALDELEPSDEGTGKERFIIDLARIASSGGQWFRGTSDQKGASGNVYSTFFFSSILIPGAMGAADLSRLIVLTLNLFPEGTPTPPPLRADIWRKRGAALKRILMTRWKTWPDRLDLWRDAFAQHKIGGRNGDNWATVMAMADMAQNEALPAADVLNGWTAKVAKHIRADLGELGTDADDFITKLLSQKFEPFKGKEAYTIAQWLMVAAALPHAPPIFGGDSHDRSAEALEAYAKQANARLAQIGMRVSPGEDKQPVLFIANNPIQGLKDLFERTAWANGAWKQSAARIKGAEKRDTVCTLAGLRTRGTWVPLTSLPGLLAFPMDQDARAQQAAAVPVPADMEDFA